MNRFLILFSLIFSIIVSACTHPPQSNSNMDVVSDENKEQSQKVYYLQHRLMPQWTFFSENVFFEDMYHQRDSAFYNLMNDMLGPEYAQGVKIHPGKTDQYVSISFPEPEGSTHCFFITLKKEEKGYSFYTYEKTMSMGEDDQVAGVVGGWSSEGAHLNFGPRTYKILEEFEIDVLGDDQTLYAKTSMSSDITQVELLTDQDKIDEEGENTIDSEKGSLVEPLTPKENKPK